MADSGKFFNACAGCWFILFPGLGHQKLVGITWFASAVKLENFKLKPEKCPKCGEGLSDDEEE